MVVLVWSEGTAVHERLPRLSQTETRIASKQCKWYTVSGIFQATYKCVQISRQTRADEVVKMILSGYGSDEPPEKFVLVESLSDSEGKLNNGIRVKILSVLEGLIFTRIILGPTFLRVKLTQFGVRRRRVFSKYDNLLPVDVVIREGNN